MLKRLSNQLCYLVARFHNLRDVSIGELAERINGPRSDSRLRRLSMNQPHSEESASHPSQSGSPPTDADCSSGSSLRFKSEPWYAHDVFSDEGGFDRRD